MMTPSVPLLLCAGFVRNSLPLSLACLVRADGDVLPAGGGSVPNAAGVSAADCSARVGAAGDIPALNVARRLDTV
jgi:hypothetical protein